MDVEEKLRSKRLYKIELLMLKLIPMILAFTALLNSILSYFGIDLYILSYIGGISIFTMVFLYLSSYVFKFCEYHRMFLHYVVITWIINIIDYYIGIPVTDLEYLCLQMIVAGISLFIILYLYVKHNKRAST
jgi:hypothetical protein